MQPVVLPVSTGDAGTAMASLGQRKDPKGSAAGKVRASLEDTSPHCRGFRRFSRGNKVLFLSTYGPALGEEGKENAAVPRYVKDLSALGGGSPSRAPGLSACPGLSASTLGSLLGYMMMVHLHRLFRNTQGTSSGKKKVVI